MTRRAAANGRCRQKRMRVIDRAADRGAAAEQLARRRLDGAGEGFADLVPDQRPVDHLHVQCAGPVHWIMVTAIARSRRPGSR